MVYFAHWLMITHEGRTQHLKRWAEELGIGQKTLYNRLKYQCLTFSQAIARPIRKRRAPTPESKEVRRRSLAAGLNPNTVAKRIQKGEKLDDALYPSKRKRLTVHASEGYVKLSHYAKEQGIELNAGSKVALGTQLRFYCLNNNLELRSTDGTTMYPRHVLDQFKDNLKFYEQKRTENQSKTDNS